MILTLLSLLIPLHRMPLLLWNLMMIILWPSMYIFNSDSINPMALQSPPIPDVDVNQAFSSPPSNVNSPAPGHIFASNLDSAISVAEYPVAADIYLSSSDSHNAVAPTVDLIHLIFKCGETLENMFSSNW